jgi:hypothetical protein
MRRNMMRLLFLPVAAVLWIIGWTLIWAGSRKEQGTQRTESEAASGDESVKMMVVLPEEQEQREA